MLRLKLIITSIFFLCCVDLSAQDPVLSDRIANYEMEINLDIESKQLDGLTQLTWKNISSDTITELYFHLYYNAFKNTGSTFFKERGMPSFLTQNIDDECGWGWSQIESFVDEAENNLIINAEYAQPDDDNAEDQTVLRIPLKNSILPGESAQFSFNWRAKIPQTMIRTGYNKEFYFFAQWFPKVGVYEPEGVRFAETGQWNCHQYHSSGEYYADFGNYKVSMSVPENYIVASSGQLTGQEKKGDKKVWKFEVNDVIDFTWSCSPHYIIQTTEYKDTEIKLYTYPYKVHLKDRYFPTIKYCMEYLENKLEPYPYPTLSIIDPPIHGMFTGGMEYPTLITSLSFEFFPEGFKTPETLVVHEYIHQYFMQMVATHEVEEAWMDEGITSFFESKILDDYLGDTESTINAFGVKSGNKQFNRAEFFGSNKKMLGPNSIKSWEYKHGGYGDIAYNKAALWLQTLEGLLGEEVMDQVFRTYFQRWKFKHPDRQDFIDVVNEISLECCSEKFPKGMDWFFEQVLFGTDLCDYKVASISNEFKEIKRGFYLDLDNCERIEEEEERFQNRVILHREGGVKIPIEFDIHFDNGDVERHYWSGQERSHDVTNISTKKITKVIIDPEYKNYLDADFINNSLTDQKQSGKFVKFFGKLFRNIQEVFELSTLVI